MANLCYFSGKKARHGKSISRRGISKKKGGIGLKTTGITTRRFHPNLQTVRIVENGTVKRVKVAASFLSTGRVVRAGRRTWKKDQAVATETPKA